MIVALIILSIWLLLSYCFENWWTQYWYKHLRGDAHRFSYYRNDVKVTVYCTYKLFPDKYSTGVILNDSEIVLLMQTNNELVKEDERHELKHVEQRRKLGRMLWANWLFIN